MLERKYIGSSGRYHNKGEHTFECWAANGPAIENKYCLGSIRDDAPAVYIALWEKKIWTRLLTGGYDIPSASSVPNGHTARGTT